jgi:hypothetical protein
MAHATIEDAKALEPDLEESSAPLHGESVLRLKQGFNATE